MKTWYEEEAERQALRRQIGELRRDLAVLSTHVDRLEAGEVVVDLRRTLVNLQTQFDRTNEQLVRYAEDLVTALGRARAAQARAEAAAREKLVAERRVATASRLVMDTLLLALDHRAPGGEAHARRVAAWAGAVAPALGTDEASAGAVRIAALLHDVGVLALPVLPVPDPATGGWQPHAVGPAAFAQWRETLPLTRAQQAVVRLHPALGARLLERIPPAAPVAPLILAHHERWDGRGYPNGRSRKELSPAEQALALAEAFDGVMAGRTSDAAPTVAWTQQALAAALGGQVEAPLVETLLTAWEQALALAPLDAPANQ